jgi:hypothetical protein
MNKYIFGERSSLGPAHIHERKVGSGGMEGFWTILRKIVLAAHVDRAGMHNSSHDNAPLRYNGHCKPHVRDSRGRVPRLPSEQKI